jgi:hypothetical protein
MSVIRRYSINQRNQHESALRARASVEGWARPLDGRASTLPIASAAATAPKLVF